MPLDLAALDSTPTAAEVERARDRARTGGEPPQLQARVVVITLVGGGLVVSGLIFWVLRELGTGVAGLVAGGFLVADLLAGALMHRNLTRALDQRRAKLYRFARDNGLEADERPGGSTTVPGRVLGHPTARVLRRWRRRQRPLWETGVVQHRASGGSGLNGTRYVALDGGQRLPLLLLAAMASTNRAGRPPTSSPVGLVPHDLEGLWPPVGEALPTEVTRVGVEDEAAHVFGEDYVVHADEVVARAYPQVLTTGLTARVVRLGVGSLEVADGWLVATLAVLGPDDRAPEWRRVEEVLDVLEELRGRLAAL